MARSSKIEQWGSRAEDYRLLGKQARNPEIRQVCDHLSRVCMEVANQTETRKADRVETAWVHPSALAYEETAQRWRNREEEYRLTAGHCQDEGVRDSWLTLAKRCGELAGFIEILQNGGKRIAAPFGRSPVAPLRAPRKRRVSPAPQRAEGSPGA